jgi:hypothetical protein
MMELISRREIRGLLATIYSRNKTMVKRLLGAVAISWQTDLLTEYIAPWVQDRAFAIRLGTAS